MEDYEIIGWPDIQDIIGKEGFEYYTTLIEPNESMGIGSSTYLVSKAWLDGNEEDLHMYKLLNTKVVDLNLSVRTLKCMILNNVETLGDLIQKTKKELLMTPNFGKKSFFEVDDLLESLNLSLGTDISKYYWYKKTNKSSK
jgi:DNA-directed RNA polymerase alpha subunit